MSLMTRIPGRARPVNDPGEVEHLEVEEKHFGVQSDQAPAKSAEPEGEVDPDPKDPEPKKSWWRRRKEIKQLEGDFASYPHLLAVKPKERYLFRSDYFEIDDSVACVLAYFHKEAAQDSFGAFWGIDRIPDGLDDRVTSVVFEQVRRMTDSWIESETKNSERLGNLEKRETEAAPTTTAKHKVAKKSDDRDEVIAELEQGASYLSVHDRLLLKAPDLETLEESIETVSRLYIDRFGSMWAAPYAGEQRQELTKLFQKNDRKRGRGFHYTSTELAGSYSLVTNGLNDRGGEYVGYMVGDVNNSVVLMDVNDYESHVVIADKSHSDYLDREFVSNMWCSKLSQATLLNNGRVVHLVLDGADLDRLGPTFEGLTSRVDLNTGDVNMFEMFGHHDDEMAIFSAHMEKLKLMFEQMHATSDGATASIIRNELEKVATEFYVDQNMWAHNAKARREELRVVGIPHAQVPLLEMFAAYMQKAHTSLKFSAKQDPDQLRALNVLSGLADNMLSTNGDLFNNHTVSAIDGARDAPRVVYDFSRLMLRGKGVAMAQLVNIIGFAVGTLDLGDTVIIHGAEHIDNGVKKYLTSQFDELQRRGGRVVYSYDDMDKMLDDSGFNQFTAADYTVFGPMLSKTVEKYQNLLAQEIPPGLGQLLTTRGENLSYLRRGVSNVVFHLDLALGINPHREAQRRQVRLEAQRVAEAKRMEQVMNEEPIPGANLTSHRTPEESVTKSEGKRAPARQEATKPTTTDKARPAQKSGSSGIRKLVRR